MENISEKLSENELKIWQSLQKGVINKMLTNELKDWLIENDNNPDRTNAKEFILKELETRDLTLNNN